MTIERIETVYGPMHVPDTDTHQYGWLKNAGVSSEDLWIRECCGLLREVPPGVSLDVGACFGCWSLPLSQVSTKVIAIEPQWDLYKLLTKTLADHDLFEVINAAAGDHAGTTWLPALDLNSPANFGDVAVGHASQCQPQAGGQTVARMLVDDMLDDDPVTFVKIDVQGMEQAALRGMARTVARCRPILFVEAHPSYGDQLAIRRQIEAMEYCCLTGRGDNYLAVPL